MIKRVNIKKILKDPLKRSELIEGAVDFICKVEGIRKTPDELAQGHLISGVLSGMI